MTKGLAVRRAKESDVAVLVSLMHGLARYHGDSIDRITEEAVLRDGFGDKPEYDVLLACLGEQPIGYVLFHDCYETGFAARGVYVVDLFVVDKERGKGAGKALLSAVAAHAKARGRSFAWWVSRQDNRAAQDAYKAMGAIAEPVVSHAFTLDLFDRYAEESAVEPDDVA